MSFTGRCDYINTLLDSPRLNLELKLYCSVSTVKIYNNVIELIFF